MLELHWSARNGGKIEIAWVRRHGSKQFAKLTVEDASPIGFIVGYAPTDVTMVMPIQTLPTRYEAKLFAETIWYERNADELWVSACHRYAADSEGV